MTSGRGISIAFWSTARACFLAPTSGACPRRWQKVEAPEARDRPGGAADGEGCRRGPGSWSRLESACASRGRAFAALRPAVPTGQPLLQHQVAVKRGTAREEEEENAFLGFTQAVNSPGLSQQGWASGLDRWLQKFWPDFSPDAWAPKPLSSWEFAQL